MATRIKFNVFNLLFRLFSFLADKTGGWQLFVKPKILFGVLILGISVSSCNTKGNNVTNSPDEQDNEALQVTCYEPAAPPVDVDSVSTVSDPVIFDPPIRVIEAMCYETAIEPTCYDPAIPDTTYDIDKIYDHVEQMPAFPGGNSELLKFINENLIYPTGEECLQGRVVCRFVVNRDGSISDIEILRSLDQQADKEAVRVIKSMPQWIPGKQNGEDVNVRFTLPVTFRLQ